MSKAQTPVNPEEENKAASQADPAANNPNEPETEDKQTQAEVNMERQIAKQEKTLKQQLDAMPKVTIEIPEDPNNPGEVVPVGWNGIIYAIPVGQQFEVPKVIYDIWKESHEKTKAINRRIRESVTKEITVM